MSCPVPAKRRSVLSQRMVLSGSAEDKAWMEGIALGPAMPCPPFLCGMRYWTRVSYAVFGTEVPYGAIAGGRLPPPDQTRSLGNVGIGLGLTVRVDRPKLGTDSRCGRVIRPLGQHRCARLRSHPLFPGRGSIPPSMICDVRPNHRACYAMAITDVGDAAYVLGEARAFSKGRMPLRRIPYAHAMPCPVLTIPHPTVILHSPYFISATGTAIILCHVRYQPTFSFCTRRPRSERGWRGRAREKGGGDQTPVSYTHLTLPTICSV
eukprot:1228394-Rhodomonas_salina.2